jgi:hypothetical protein
LYNGPEGTLFGEIEVDGRFFIHSLIFNPGTPSGVRGCRRILSELEEQLRARGFERYYTMADSPSGFRFNELMGFKTNLEVWNNELEVMVKEL